MFLVRLYWLYSSDYRVLSCWTTPHRGYYLGVRYLPSLFASKQNFHSKQGNGRVGDLFHLLLWDSSVANISNRVLLEHWQLKEFFRNPSEWGSLRPCPSVFKTTDYSLGHWVPAWPGVQLYELEHQELHRNTQAFQPRWPQLHRALWIVYPSQSHWINSNCQDNWSSHQKTNLSTLWWLLGYHKAQFNYHT